ncbi:23S rRNA (pseudouridine(1915)-N(3))-methyltransferase RlmH [bacterium]|nr:23S rRNA (pseudouridine(1915)-N(3))-methyltransferase RlmH [bacterium]
MKIKIYLDGKIKESFFKDGILEYQKRLYDNVEVIECGQNLMLAQMSKENAYKIALVIEGKMLSSEAFAEKISEITQDGYYNEILFFIGGADGLSQEIKSKADFGLSFSRMTFVHQHAVFILVEQLYRAHRILSGAPYHH